MLHRFTVALSLALIGLLGASTEGADKVRVGILGFDNYQAVEYVQFFNNPAAEEDLSGLVVTAAYPVVSPDYPKSAELTEMWKAQMLNAHKDKVPPVEMVDSTEALLQRCDAVMIWSLDSKMHLEQVTAVLKAGKPCFVGRPLAASAADAVAMFKLAAELKVRLWSCSQHRYSPGFYGMRNHPEVGKVLGCDVYGGFDMNAAPADQATRGIHSIETLYSIMGPGVVKLSCESTPITELVTAVWSDGRIGTFRGVKQGAVKYSATVFGDAGVSTSGIYGHGIPTQGIVPTNDKYMGYGGLAIQLAKFFKTGEVPVQPSETLEMYSFWQAMDESRAQGGAVVELKKLGAE